MKDINNGCMYTRECKNTHMYENMHYLAGTQKLRDNKMQKHK